MRLALEGLYFFYQRVLLKPYKQRRSNTAAGVIASPVFHRDTTDIAPNSFAASQTSWNYQPVRAGNPSARVIGSGVLREHSRISETSGPARAENAGKKQAPLAFWRFLRTYVTRHSQRVAGSDLQPRRAGNLSF